MRIYSKKFKVYDKSVSLEYFIRTKDVQLKYDLDRVSK